MLNTSKLQVFENYNKKLTQKNSKQKIVNKEKNTIQVRRKDKIEQKRQSKERTLGD